MVYLLAEVKMCEKMYVIWVKNLADVWVEIFSCWELRHYMVGCFLGVNGLIVFLLKGNCNKPLQICIFFFFSLFTFI